MLGGTIQASSDDPAAEVLIEKAIDGHACRAGNTFNDVVWNEWLADAVSKHRDEEDDATRRQLRKLAQEAVPEGVLKGK